MTITRNTLFATGVLFFLTLLTGCDNQTPDPTLPIKSEIIRDLPADPIQSTGTGQQPAAVGKFTFFSFEQGILPSSDSASTRWDLAFRATTILVNGGTSGPGMGGVVMQQALFSEVKEAPLTGFVQDGPSGLAIPAGSGRGWFTYNPTTNTITPIPGRVFIIKTATGRYAKLEILSYYKGAPAVPTAADASRHYTFRYVYQPNETNKFD